MSLLTNASIRFLSIKAVQTLWGVVPDTMNEAVPSIVLDITGTVRDGKDTRENVTLRFEFPRDEADRIKRAIYEWSDITPGAERPEKSE